MNKREQLIVKYADDLKHKCGVNPNLELLTKVTIGCGHPFITKMPVQYLGLTPTS